jgi:hypothetical protein
MTTCPRCARENTEDHDFCQCGEYLRWEPTSYRPTVRRSPTDRPPGAEEQAARRPTREPELAGSAPSVIATLLLRLPEGEFASPESVTVTAEPGGRVTVLGLVRNESKIVDNYDLTIQGLPEGWWTVAPHVAYLVPYGTSGSYQQELEAHLHPPRAPKAYARSWPFEVVARSRAYATTAASVPATLIVTPYIDISTQVKPDRATGRWKTRYVLTVRNDSNAATDVSIRGEDTDGRCRFRFPQRMLTVRPGEQNTMQFAVRPPRQIWIGKPLERHLSVLVTPTGVPKPLTSAPVMFRQRAWLPKWLMMLLIVLLVIAVVVLVVELAGGIGGGPGTGTTSPAG